MNSGRLTWLLCFALAVMVTVAGQFRSLEICELGEGDGSVSVPDDSLAIATKIVPEVPALALARPIRFEARLPSERLTDADIFRPPNRLRL